MIIKLGILGEKKTEQPKSLATAFEFVSLWAGESDNSVLARLCAGAIGLYIDGLKILPKYKPFSEKPLEYGHKCLDRLLEKAVYPPVIFEAGTMLLAHMATLIPAEQEVKEAENFSHSVEPDT